MKNITILEGLVLSAVAMAIIIALLCIIMGLIYLMSATVKEMDGKSFKDVFRRLLKKKGKEETESASESAAVIKSEGAGTQGTEGLKLYNVSDKDAAIIMAVVADTTGIPLNQLKFKSIRGKGE